MAAIVSCPKCGAPINNEVLEGFCSACMLEGGLVDASDSPAVETLPSRHQFGDYELLEEIARGGMGVVYRARQISLNRIVALKMILAGRLASEIEVQRFRDEARAAAALRHPNIIAIHEVGEIDGQPFFTMDLVEGTNLAEAVRQGPFAAKRAAACVRSVAEAIHFAHERGILHRDLKPSNVLLDDRDVPHVTDFGLAKRLTDFQLSANHLQLTLSGQVLGSPNFMPPEQAAGKHRELTPSSDVYSLGALLYHLVTGHPPFLAENIPATLRMVAETEPVAPRRTNARVPRDLETICLKCLEKDQVRRYATARELAEELDRFLRDEPIHARPLSRLEKFARLGRRHPAIAVLSVVAGMLLIALATVSLAYVSRARGKPYVLPQMVEPPRSQSVRPGSTVSFHATVQGTPPLEYQWSFQGSPVAGATNTTLIRTNVQPVDSGEYVLSVTNTGYGHSLSAAARLFVHPHPDLVPDPTGLAAWWSGEGDALDLSGGGHHGAVSTGVSFVSGPFGQAFHFDGVTGHVVSVTNSAALILTGAMSIIAWVKPDQITNATILSKYDVSRPDRPNGISFMVVFDANRLRFEVAASPSPAGFSPFRMVETDATLVPRSVFAQVAATFDPATQAMSIFVNGNAMPVSLVAGSSNVPAIYHTQVPVRLGALVGPSDKWSLYSGSIDEVGLFTRALRAEEIAASYAAGRDAQRARESDRLAR